METVTKKDKTTTKTKNNNREFPHPQEKRNMPLRSRLRPSPLPPRPRPRPMSSPSLSILLQGRQGKGEEGRHGSSVSSSPVSHLAPPRFPRLPPTRAARDSLRRQDFFFNEPAQRCGRMARSVRLEAAGGDSRRQRELFFHLGQFALGAASTTGAECVQWAWGLASPPFLRRSPAPDGRGGQGKGEEGSHGPSISSPPVPPSGSPRFRRRPPPRATRSAPRAARRAPHAAAPRACCAGFNTEKLKVEN